METTANRARMVAYEVFVSVCVVILWYDATTAQPVYDGGTQNISQLFVEQLCEEIDERHAYPKQTRAPLERDAMMSASKKWYSKRILFKYSKLLPDQLEAVSIHMGYEVYIFRERKILTTLSYILVY